MYTEFIIIYVLLAVAIALGIVNLIFTIKKNGKGAEQARNYNIANPQAIPEAPPAPGAPSAPVAPQPQAQSTVNNAGNHGVAFCTKCAHQFPGNEKFCPYCGTPRN